MRRAEEGFTVLDGVAIVAGAAVASVHLRGALRHEATGPGWVVVWGTFAWVALTAAGPFVFLTRKFARALPGYPQVGDRLWALLGTPWLLTALHQTGPSGAGAAPHPWLGVGLAGASMVAAVVVWATWVAVSPEQASANFAAPWSNRLGLVLAVAWPVQCGLGMVVSG